MINYITNKIRIKLISELESRILATINMAFELDPVAVRLQLINLTVSNPNTLLNHKTLPVYEKYNAEVINGFSLLNAIVGEIAGKWIVPKWSDIKSDGSHDLIGFKFEDMPKNESK